MVLLLASCQVAPDFDDYWSVVYDIPPIDYGGLTVPDIAAWVSNWVAYTKDDGEEWATPEQTYRTGRGDCEDHVILLMYLVHRDTGLLPRMIAGKLYGRGHAWMEVAGVWWESTAGRVIYDRTEYQQEYSLEYAETMGIAQEYRAVKNPREPSPGGKVAK